jgi:ADP-ribose pyrophosphatase
VHFRSLREPRDGWEVVASETRFDDPHLRVVDESVRTPARQEPRRWLVAQRKAAVVVAPLTRDGRLVLIRQERIPIRRAIWEVPAGQIDESEYDHAAVTAVAQRELQEETGYQIAADGELLPVGELFSSPGFTDEHAYLFLARNVEPAPDGHARQESESILDCRAFTAAELREMIASGELRDANTLSICAQLAARGFLQLHS